MQPEDLYMGITNFGMSCLCTYLLDFGLDHKKEERPYTIFYFVCWMIGVYSTHHLVNMGGQNVAAMTELTLLFVGYLIFAWRGKDPWREIGKLLIGVVFISGIVKALMTLTIVIFHEGDGSLVIGSMKEAVLFSVLHMTYLFVVFWIFYHFFDKKGWYSRVPKWIAAGSIVLTLVADGSIILTEVFSGHIYTMDNGLVFMYRYYPLLYVLGIIAFAVVQKRQLEKEKRLLQEQVVLMQNHYRAIEMQGEMIRKIRHDMENHLQTMGHLAKTGEYESMRRLTEQMKTEYEDAIGRIAE